MTAWRKVKLLSLCKNRLYEITDHTIPVVELGQELLDPSLDRKGYRSEYPLDGPLLWNVQHAYKCFPNLNPR